MRAALLLLCLGGLGCGGAPDSQEWTTARTGDLLQGVEVTGMLSSADTALIGPPAVDSVWNFNITFLAAEGEDVAAGDKVLAFDTQELSQRLASEQNTAATRAKELEKRLTSVQMARRDEELALAEAEAGVRRARMQTTGSPDLTASVTLRVAALDLALAEAQLAAERAKTEAARRRDQSEVEALERSVAEARASVSRLEADIARMTVAAPRGGTVLHSERNGEKPKVGDQVWRARKPLEIVALDDIHGDGEVDEMDGSRVAVGQPVRLRLDAHPDIELRGEVASVLQSVKRRSREDPRKIVRVQLSLLPSDAVQLRPGMRFRGLIETGRIEQTLLVDADALFIDRQGPHVWRQRAGGAERLAVETGARNRTDVQLLSGLAEGDRVSLSAQGEER